MSTSSDLPEKKKASTLKVIGIYILVWVGILSLFFGYIMLAPKNGGFTQDSANLVAQLLGMAFVVGFIGVLAVKLGVHIFPKEHKRKSYFDDAKK